MTVLDFLAAFIKILLLPLDLPFIKIWDYGFPFGLIFIFFMKPLIPIMFWLFFKLKEKEKSPKIIFDYSVTNEERNKDEEEEHE